MKYLEDLVKVNSLLNTKIFELERELKKTKEEIKKNILKKKLELKNLNCLKS